MIVQSRWGHFLWPVVVGELSRDVDGDEDEDGDGDVMDGGDEDRSLVSGDFLLRVPPSPPPSVTAAISSLIMQSFFNRSTSDSFTGFTMKPSAPSSKHLIGSN